MFWIKAGHQVELGPGREKESACQGEANIRQMGSAARGQTRNSLNNGGAWGFLGIKLGVKALIYVFIKQI